MAASARVVTAAGLIMISVFGSFIFGDNAVIKAIGLALAVGVGIDAFVVRVTFVPAVLKILGHAAWALPAWLDHIVPNFDVEGPPGEAERRLGLRGDPDLWRTGTRDGRPLNKGTPA